MENTEENIEKIWKIRKKILKRYKKYGRKLVEQLKVIKNMEERPIEQ